MAVNRPDPVRNLGHKATDASLTKNPAGRVQDYTNHAGEGIVRGPARSVGVYGSFKNPTSGISTNEQNLDRWAGYAKANSYTGRSQVAGPGEDPPVSDDSRRLVPSAAREKGSDGYLESTKSWPSFEYGSESGLGRIEKARK